MLGCNTQNKPHKPSPPPCSLRLPQHRIPPPPHHSHLPIPISIDQSSSPPRKHPIHRTATHRRYARVYHVSRVRPQVSVSVSTYIRKKTAKPKTILHPRKTNLAAEPSRTSSSWEARQCDPPPCRRRPKTYLRPRVRRADGRSPPSVSLRSPVRHLVRPPPGMAYRFAASSHTPAPSVQSSPPWGAISVETPMSAPSTEALAGLRADEARSAAVASRCRPRERRPRTAPSHEHHRGPAPEAVTPLAGTRTPPSASFSPAPTTDHPA
ncbi:pollen-specific leucine-rich repeat extensin-like protein 3 [Iris pallida]|uniref:Pollen-specific leucine-rich repeat extensin-like protein 3 n=1 Tax=Iris pallida TaxID=29817 RepID=A0AAX6EPK4_IRIPA|nr:pollen-specific leucine-rich repeat extensin-like protein 3 [Iris pallida]